MSIDAAQLVDRLTRAGQRVVLAESCTAGAIAAEVGGVAGVSATLCGSAVVYDPTLKSDWLGVDRETIETQSAESAAVAHQMVIGVMRKTPLATLGLSVTGHLGPGVDEAIDGIVYFATAQRGGGDVRVEVHQRQLHKPKRMGRCREAVQIAMELIASQLD